MQVGCIYLFIGHMEQEEGAVSEHNKWVLSEQMQQESDGHQWLFIVYWGMCVTLGIGFDIVPRHG